MDLHVASDANDDASISSSGSDEGYKEFLRFLRAPSTVSTTDDKEKGQETAGWHKEGPSLEGGTNEDSLPESLPDGPVVMLGGVNLESDPENSQVPGAENEENDDESFYIGPGEVGFTHADSVHDSDISESASENEQQHDEGGEDGSASTTHSNSSAVDGEEMKTIDTKEGPNDDEGYNEFLRFLMSPTIAVSVRDDGSVVLSVSVQYVEIGSVTLSVKNDASIGSMDAGYEGFLLFLRSPSSPFSTVSNNSLDKAAAEEIQALSPSLGKETDMGRGLTDKPLEEAGNQEAYARSSNFDKLTDVTVIEQVAVEPLIQPETEETGSNKLIKATASGQVYAKSPCPEPLINAKIEGSNKLMEAAAIAAAALGLVVSRPPSPEPVNEAKAENIKTAADGAVSACCPSHESLNYKEIDETGSMKVMEAAAIDTVVARSPGNGTEAEETGSDKVTEAASREFYSQSPNPEQVNDIIADESGLDNIMKVAVIGTALGAVTTRSSSPEPVNETKDKKTSPERLMETTAIGQVCARSPSPGPLDDTEVEKSTKLMPAAAAKAEAEKTGKVKFVGTAASQAAPSQNPRPEPVNQTKDEESGPGKLIKVAAIGTAFDLIARSPNPDPMNEATEDEKTIPETLVEAVATRAAFAQSPSPAPVDESEVEETGSSKLVKAAKLGRDIAVARPPCPEPLNESVIAKARLLSPISKIYFADADLGEDDLVQYPSQDLWECTEFDNFNLQSPVSRISLDECRSPTDSKSDLSEVASVHSPRAVKSLEVSVIQEKALQPPSPLVIVGNISIKEGFLQSLSSASSFDDFFDCRSQASVRLSSLGKSSGDAEFADVSVRSASPVISLGDFYDCLSEMPLKRSESESELSMLSKEQSAEFIIRTFLLSLVFHICQLRIESGVVEIGVWGPRFMRKVSK